MADKIKKDNSKIEALYDWISVDLQGVKEELMVELKLSAAQIASMYDSIKSNSEESTSAIAQEIRYSYKQNQNIYDGMAALMKSEVAQKLDSMDEKLASLERLEAILGELNDLKYSYMQLQTIYEGFSSVLTGEVSPKVESILEKVAALDSVEASLQEISAKLAEGGVGLTEEETKRIVDDSVSVHNQQVLNAIAAIPFAENVDYVRITEEVGDKVLELLNEMKGVEATIDYDRVAGDTAEKVVESLPYSEPMDYTRLNEMIDAAVASAMNIDALAEKVAAKISGSGAAEGVDYNAIAEAVAAKVKVPEVTASAEVDYDTLAAAVVAKMGVPEVKASAEVDYDALATAVAAKMGVPEVTASAEVDYDALATAVVAKMGVPEVAAPEVDYDALAAVVAAKIAIPEVKAPEMDYDAIADRVLDKLAAKGISADVVLDDEGIEKIAETVAEKVGTVDNIDYDKVCLAAQAAQILPDPVDYDRVAEIVEDKLTKSYEDIERVVTLNDEGIEKIVNGVADELRNMTLVCEYEEVEAAEEPVVEETPVEEEVVEEVVEEAVVEEVVVEAVVEEPVESTATEEIAATSDFLYQEGLDGELIDAETGLVIRLKRSFTAKMKQSDEKVKSYYSDIKNELISYKKINSNVSWHGDRFNLGRDTVAKIGINGKTLCFYIDLDPNDPELKQTVYHQKDVSAQKAYESTPFMVKIKSDAALKKALRLIAILAEKRGAEKDDKFAPIDYVAEFAYESTKSLFEAGYIKATKEKKVDFNF